VARRVANGSASDNENVVRVRRLAVGMSYCGQCGQGTRDAEQFCIACGQRLRRPEESPRQALADESTGGELAPVASEDRIVLQHAVNLLARRDASTAVAVLERLCAERPEWAVARAYLGIAYLRSTRVAEARWEVEEAVRQAPESFICRTKLAEFLARLGFYDQAMAQLDRAMLLPVPDIQSHHAAMELRQFCKDKSKGIFYRETGYPRLSRLVPRRRTQQVASTVQPERGN